jgi:hypothetical protein
MKKIFFSLIAILSFTQLFAQDFCADADSNLIYAYSNVKSAYESNNLDHLKYYSKKSLKSFEEAKTNLKKCDCELAYNLTYNAAKLLTKVETQETFEDGRFYVKRAKEIAQKSITALNEFTAEKNSDMSKELSASEDEPKDIEEKQKLIKE